MFLCNIVTDSNYKFEKFCNISNGLSTIDNTLPTLIVGWGKTKEFFPKQSILEYSINENISWCYSKNEDRMHFIEEINKFYKNIFYNLHNKIKYIIFDVKIEPYSKIKRFINMMDSDKTKVCYVYENKFIYINVDDYVIGVSLDDLSYLSIRHEKIIKRIGRNNKNNIIMNDFFNDKTIKKEIKWSKIIIPYIYKKVNNI